MAREDYYRKRARNHADIRRLLKQMNGPQVNVDSLADALNALNAAGILAETQRKFTTSYLCYGPKTVRDDSETPYLGSVIWCRPTGYYHYETLTIFGIWAIPAEDHTQILMGTRCLEFCLPFYQPEQYHYDLRKDFAKFYGKETPPPEQPLHTLAYQSDSRIDQRFLVQTLVERWANSFQDASSSSM